MNTLEKKLIVASLAAMVPLTAFGATEDSVTIADTIDAVSSLSAAKTTAMDLDNGQDGVHTLTINDNSVNGFKIEMKSTNGGLLLAGSDGTKPGEIMKLDILCVSPGAGNALDDGTYVTQDVTTQYKDLITAVNSAIAADDETTACTVSFDEDGNTVGAHIVGNYSDEIFYRLKAL